MDAARAQRNTKQTTLAHNPLKGEILAPSGTFGGGGISEGIMRAYDYSARQDFEWRYDSPAYFWATRDGVRGVDFP